MSHRPQKIVTRLGCALMFTNRRPREGWVLNECCFRCGVNSTGVDRSEQLPTRDFVRNFCRSQIHNRNAGYDPGNQGSENSGVEAMAASFPVSVVAHFALGAVKSLITIRSWWASGL